MLLFSSDAITLDLGAELLELKVQRWMSPFQSCLKALEAKLEKNCQSHKELIEAMRTIRSKTAAIHDTYLPESSQTLCRFITSAETANSSSKQTRSTGEKTGLAADHSYWRSLSPCS